MYSTASSMLESMWSSMSSSMQLAEECLREEEGQNSLESNPVEGIEMFAHAIDSSKFYLHKVIGRLKLFWLYWGFFLTLYCIKNRKLKSQLWISTDQLNSLNMTLLDDLRLYLLKPTAIASTDTEVTPALLSKQFSSLELWCTKVPWPVMNSVCLCQWQWMFLNYIVFPALSKKCLYRWLQTNWDMLWYINIR